MTSTRERWRAASPDATWEAKDYYLDGSEWPEEVELRAWQVNDNGERRIVAARKYRLVEAA